MKKVYFLIIFSIIFISFLLFYHDIKELVFSNKSKINVVFIINDYGTRNFEKLIISKIEKVKTFLDINIFFKVSKNYAEQKDIAIESIKNGSKIIVFYNGLYAKNYVNELAKNYKNVYFVLVDVELENYPSNVVSFNYNYNEMGFIASNICNVLTKTGNIGFIGGLKISSIMDIENGASFATEIYNENYKKNNKLFSFYISSDYPFKTDKSAFSNPEAGTYFAEKLFKEKKTDFIIASAGNSNSGVYEVAKKYNFYVINFDSTEKILLSQNNVAFSIIRNIDKCLISIIDSILKGRIQNKNYKFGLDTNSFTVLSSGLIELKEKNLEEINIINKYYLKNK